MLEPTTFPMAIPAAPARAACTETRSSGVEVPKPTTVSPMTRGGTRNLSASALAPCTSQLPPKKSPARPRANRR